MSLIYLANAVSDDNGIHNNDFQTTFRTAFSLPPHAKVSVESAYFPLNPVITIVNGVNSLFEIEGYANDILADSWSFQGNIPSGTYNEQTLCTAIQSIAQAGLNAIVLAPSQVPLYAPPNQWTIQVNFNNTLNIDPNQPSFLISYNVLIDNFYPGAGNITYDFICNFNSGIINDVYNKNNLANIMGWNNQLNQDGSRPLDFGIMGEDFIIPNNNATKKYALIEGNSTFENNGPSLAYNSTNLLVVEIQELGTQLFNSYTKDKQPAVCVVPYTDANLTDGYVLYKPQFPLELHASNEEQTFITTLSVKVREGDGQLANLVSMYERSYVVLRIETTQDLEKQDLHLLAREKRLAFLRNSLVHQLPK